jgi:hypothetical protein
MLKARDIDSAATQGQPPDLLSLSFEAYSYSVGEIPVARAAVLKHILRSLHRMMQSSGTSEGLRGLIDTSILRSIKRIIEYRGLFGPSVLPIGMRFLVCVLIQCLKWLFSHQYHGYVRAQ